MKVFTGLFVLLGLLVSLSCSSHKISNNKLMINDLIKHYFADQVIIIEHTQPTFKKGDFNGDGREDIVLLFHPKTMPKATSQIKVSTPWMRPGKKLSNTYRQSIAIIHGDQDGNWLSDKNRVFALVDTFGVLETPSFELLVSRKTDPDYPINRAMLPEKKVYDLIIIPTEAGIDTYIYWDNDNYTLLEPEEMP